MLQLITGGSASGKSAYAESQVINLGEDRKRYYLATMKPWGEETRQRILRHQEMRRQKQFTTLECYTDVAALLVPKRLAGEKSVILLECMSNLVANEQYLNGGTEAEIGKRILMGIQYLQKQADDIIIVTNEVFSDGRDYAAETKQYIRMLGSLNQQLGAMAHVVIEVVYGIPIVMKAETNSGGTG